MTFPLPLDLRDDERFRPFCRWCGVRLSDRRRRYCGKDHESQWVSEVLLREAFWYQRKKALKRDNYECSHCGISEREHKRKHAQGLHVHHIIMRSNGGSNYVDNLLTLCRDCHIEVHSGGASV